VRRGLAIVVVLLLGGASLRSEAILKGRPYESGGATTALKGRSYESGGYGPAGGSVVEPALERFLARPAEPLTQYRAARHMEARNDRFNLRASLDAITTLTADGRFTYTITSEEGSEYIRNKVLRALLENEEKLFATTSPDRAALTTSNYELIGGEAAEPGVVRLFAKPRRKEVLLFEGSVFVTQDDSDLLRVEGRLARNPSFWTTRVDLVRRYERIAGIRVPTRLDTTAQIRLAGPATMSIDYDYEMVDGVTLR
jgi:hypothetical protein